MRKKARRNTILIDGIRYYAEKPETCRMCFFWKNRKVGCILGKQNCYYLAEAVMTEQEKKCEGCCYAKGRPCVSAKEASEGEGPEHRICRGLESQKAGLRRVPSGKK